MGRRLNGWAGYLWVALLLVLALSAGAQQGIAADSVFLAPKAGDGPAWDPVVWSRLLEQTLPMRDDGSSDMQQQRLGLEKAPSELNAILVMCDFSDSLMLGRHGIVNGVFPPPAQMERFYSAHDSLYFDHLLSVVSDYYSTVSGGRFNFRFTIHPWTVNLPEPMAYYGNHPQKGEQKIELVTAVIEALDADIPFDEYDTIMVVHAGAGEETDILGDSPEQIYSSFLSREDFEEAVTDGILDDPYIPCDDFPAGSGIEQVLLLPETEYQDPYGETWDGHFGSLGVYCFEIGLRLGMLSLSDFTPSNRPDSQGIGQYGLMGYGLFTAIGLIPPHPCAFNKTLMGWVDPIELDPGSFAEYEMYPRVGAHDMGTVYRVSLTGQEYWLLEYRLQDPDGNRAFSFPDDKNGNHVYDYWDADAPNNRPYPGVDFDAAADSLERPLGGEWDFAMSENNARGLGELGFGSGVYIWHIDEGRIRDVFDSPTNLFNADPWHKSVDLEEADGIQDLDTAEPTAYWLGSDDDSFRAEGAASFGPDTNPATETASGARTGISFSEFSQVFNGFTADTLYADFTVEPPVVLMGLDYADTISFSLVSEFSAPGEPDVAIRKEFPPGVDLRGSHVLIADLDVEADDGCENSGPAEIVIASASGAVFVLDENLDEYLDQDGDPAVLSPLVTGTRDGAAVRWNLPAAVGDMDGDGAPEIVLTSKSGIYAFNPDGSEVRPAAVGSFGLYADLVACDLPPILIPSDWEGLYCSTESVEVVAVEQADGESWLSTYNGSDGQLQSRFQLGEVHVPSPPVFAIGSILVAVDDTTAGRGRLRIFNNHLYSPEAPRPVSEVDLHIRPGVFPISIALTDPSDGEESTLAVHVPGRDGGVETVIFESDLMRVVDHFVWRDEVEVRSPLAPGQAFVGDGRMGRAGHFGHWQNGWPRIPSPATAPHDEACAGSPLVARVSGSDLPLWQYLFPARDGRIFGLGTKGEPAPFWPLGGPARSAGTPGAGSISGIGTGDLVAIGTFERINGLDSDDGVLSGQDVSSIFLWENVLEREILWSMWGGSPWRNGFYDLASSVSPPYAADGAGLVPGSLSCYPSPLISGPLFVRASLRSPGRARVFVYNLEGQEMTRTGWVNLSAPDPFSIEVGLGQAVTGLYLCRLEVEKADGGTESSVIQFAVVH
jgi:M6 family metalloprotease-like protein